MCSYTINDVCGGALRSILAYYYQHESLVPVSNEEFFVISHMYGDPEGA